MLLETLIPSRVRCKVLRSLFLAPDARTDYPRGLALKLELPYMPVQQELQHLRQANILQVQESAGRHIYSINRAYPLYRALRTLLKQEASTGTSFSLPVQIRSVIRHMREHLPKGSTIVLFGSRAQGTDRKNSDWDIGIQSSQPIALKTYLQLKARVRDLAWPHRVDVVDFQRVTPQFRELALRHVFML